MAFSLQITRKLTTSSCLMIRNLSKRRNPGLGHQISVIEDAVNVIQSDPEGFEGLESDLFNAHQSHKKHELDLKRQSEKIKMHMIENKYFRKDSLPNMLTYAEKEQIKFLHSSDEEEWTVEKLAESFPANTEVISKILKSRWNPMSHKRICSHDAAVLKNWERFKNGEYKENMTAELNEHLMKFADSRANSKIFQNATSLRKKEWQKPKSNEFSSIISSLRPKNVDGREIGTLLENKTKVKEIRSENIDGETYLLGEIKSKKPITIHQLKNKNFLKSNKDCMMRNDETNSLDQSIEEKSKNFRGIEIVDDKNTSYKDSTNCTEKFVSTEMVISDSDARRYEMSATKQRIHIPRKLWRKGATYRANDCYYDDDGEFLYKVPGMA